MVKLKFCGAVSPLYDTLEKTFTKFVVSNNTRTGNGTTYKSCKRDKAVFSGRCRDWTRKLKDTAWNPKRFVCHPTNLPSFFVRSGIRAKRRVPRCNLVPSVVRVVESLFRGYPRSSKEHDDSVRPETVFVIFSGISFPNISSPLFHPARKLRKLRWSRISHRNLFSHFILKTLSRIQRAQLPSLSL